MASDIFKVSANLKRNKRFDKTSQRVIYLKLYQTYYVLKKNLAGQMKFY